VRIPDILETNLSRFKTTSTFEENQAESRKMRGREWGGFVIAQLSCATTPADCSQVNKNITNSALYNKNIQCFVCFEVHLVLVITSHVELSKLFTQLLI
jgi:hypothetical protein